MRQGEWRPPIIKTEATTGRGVPELWAAIQAYRRALETAPARAPQGPRRVPAARAADAHVSGAPRASTCSRRARCRRCSSASPRARVDPYSAAADILAAGAVTVGIRDQGSEGSGHRDRGRGHESDAGSHRHCGAGTSTRRWRSIATRWPRGRGARGGRVAARARAFHPVGESALELLEATAPDSAIARYVDKRGPGIHHITLRVDDIHARCWRG